MTQENFTQMKEFNKEEYNQMCAEFLGAVIEQPYPANKDYEQDGYVIYFPKDTVTLGIYRNYSLKGLKFDSDWNWIMEIYIKINQLIQQKQSVDFVFGKESDPFHLALWDAFEIEDCSKEAVVEAIWNFLNWYNEHISKTFR